MNTIKIGCNARDLATGFEGLVQSRNELLGGSIQFTLQPRVKADAPGLPDAYNIDEHQLEFVDAGISDRSIPALPCALVPGNKIRDLVSGFTGIAISKVTFLNGCIYMNVEAPVDPKHPNADRTKFLSVARLALVDSGIAKQDLTPQGQYLAPSSPRKPGGPTTRAQRPA